MVANNLVDILHNTVEVKDKIKDLLLIQTSNFWTRRLKKLDSSVRLGCDNILGFMRSAPALSRWNGNYTTLLLHGLYSSRDSNFSKPCVIR